MIFKKKEINKQILDVFKDLQFVDTDNQHYYYLASDPDKRFTSATSILKKLDDFDEKYWSNKKAKERGVTPEVILQEWKDISTKATKQGSEVHKFMENKALKMNTKGLEVDKYKPTLMKLYRDMVGKYKIVCTELRMYDPDLGICGTCDKLAFNLQTKKFALLDYKTGKPIQKVETYVDKYTGQLRESKFNLKAPYDHLPKSNYSKYSLQLSIYKYILEKRANIIVDEMCLIHITPDEYSYHPVDYINPTLLWS